MISNVCFMVCSSVPHSQVLLGSTIQILSNMVKNIAMHNGKRVLHNVINLYIYIYIYIHTYIYCIVLRVESQLATFIRSGS